MLDDSSEEMIDDFTDESSGSEYSFCSSECSDSYESSFVSSDSSESEGEWL